VIWALFEDLLLVQLGLVVGRVALVEVGHLVLLCVAAARRRRAGRLSRGTGSAPRSESSYC